MAQILIQTHVAAAMVQGQTKVSQAYLGLYDYGSRVCLSRPGNCYGYWRFEAGGSSGGDSNYAGAYDKGGYIPTGKHGIVGEYGPEIVNGPAHVTGREATARKLGGNSGPQAVTISHKST